ncbi:Low molecular weight phosphotyrosine protein phosphatase [Taphrina deformans PYCC 5710]|uniref:Low molecular weight phosphotyrosine protein phosphatase n=1 Tax=Taphrina deformans (strain PYCC 5710 / ATCC 11124 / CBS 356.35 / IMI 108563 / JCM 9778 / NBRC 8474) TaxID=1097556 RepID=R4XH70_TAPDE|nr:Low molecular weight phosphotyrosine protein phosphatase [Taphrina deformans PYCC 5710]|eukprot:CCG82736.1 Low molecular weight phosphotyrosine protein phosphatase [Taphrina deformans PYCC 5710]
MSSILFVCLGNICRSTMAHAVLQHLVEQEDLQDLISNVDSCGNVTQSATDWKALNLILERWQHSDNMARQLSAHDFERFDFILAMDRSNLSNIKSMQPRGQIRASIHLFGDFGDRSMDAVVKDPYYDAGNLGFDKAYQQCLEFSKGLIHQLQAHDSDP